jgi:diguanylate cyclase (GGDEF)-like protein
MNNLSALEELHSILLIEDSKGSALLIKKELKPYMTNRCEVTHVTALEEALNLLVQRKFDIALLDRFLPDAQGFSGLYSIQKIAPDLPIIYLTGYKDEQAALESIRQGAQDYVFKDQLDGAVLKRSIQFAILRKKFEETLIIRANSDMLTGLANRMMYENRLDMALAKASRDTQNIAVFFIDLDKFKQINDTLGHAAGDEILIEVGRRIKHILRSYDTVARFGGDEFVVLIEPIIQLDLCVIMATKIIEALNEPFAVCSQKLHLSVSIGIASCGAGQEKTREQIMREADEAMYQAKEISGSSYQKYPGAF